MKATPVSRTRWRAAIAARKPWLVYLVYAIALAPALYMTSVVLGTTDMQYLDYWASLPLFIDEDGDLSIRGLFSYQNEHPMVVPHVVYYLNTELFAGANRGLGLYSVAVTLVAIVVLSMLLPRSWSPLLRAAAVVGISAVMFCPTGVWNFARGMSGTAWLTANMFALIAILFALRDRTLLATGAALAAVASYGTGFAAPVAIAVIALLRRGERWRWLLPLAALGVTGTFYLLTRNPESVGGDSTLPQLASSFLSLLGMMWDPTASPLSIGAGVIGLTLLGVALIEHHSRRSNDQMVAWWGVAIYAILACGLIASSRAAYFDGDGTQSRYMSLSALFWIAVAGVSCGMLMTSVKREIRIAAVAASIVIAWAASSSAFSLVLNDAYAQDVLAAAVVFDAGGGPYEFQMPNRESNVKRLKAMGNYPFDGPLDLGCGLTPDDSIDVSAVRRLRVDAVENLGIVDSDTRDSNTHWIRGWVWREGLPVECAVVIDSAGQIVGGGTHGIPRADVRAARPKLPETVGFELVTPPGQTDYRVVLGFPDGFWSLPLPSRAGRPAQ